MTAGIVVGRILLAADEELRVEELAVAAGADFVDRGRIEVDEDGARDVFAVARLGEEGLEGAGIAEVVGIGIRTTVGAEPVLQEVAGDEAGSVVGGGGGE